MPEIKDTITPKKHTIGSKGKWYSPLTDQIYTFQSAYERELMNFLDNHEIKWAKNKERFPYLRDGKTHYYVPDFYLPEQNLYIETKGFIRKSDPLKFEAFPADKPLTLLLYEDMVRLGCKVFAPTVDHINSNKWPMNILKTLDEWQQPGVLSRELSERVSSVRFFEIIK